MRLRSTLRFDFLRSLRSPITSRLIVSAALQLAALSFAGCKSTKSAPDNGIEVIAATPAPALPGSLTGDFSDDYGIRYTITRSLWLQQPNSRYQIIAADSAAHFLVARNAPTNPSEPGLFTRMDWILLPDMAPYTWAFCLNAPTADSARRVTPPNGATPRTGCNGFPFSRMKRG